MPPHKCNHEDDLREIKEKVAASGTLLRILFGLISIFICLDMFSVAQASGAREQVSKVKAKVDVHEERFIHILKGIEDIKKTLKEKR